MQKGKLLLLASLVMLSISTINAQSNDIFAFNTSKSAVSGLKKNIFLAPADEGKVKTHLVFFDLVKPLFHQISFGYEYNHSSAKWAIRVPVGFAVGSVLGNKRRYNEYAVEFKYYITANDSYDREIGPWSPGFATFRGFAGGRATLIQLHGPNAKVIAPQALVGFSWQFEMGLNITGYGAVGPGFFMDPYTAGTNVYKAGSVALFTGLSLSVGWGFGSAE